MKKIRMIKSVYDNPQAETIHTFKIFSATATRSGKEGLKASKSTKKRVRVIPVKMEEYPGEACQDPTTSTRLLQLLPESQKNTPHVGPTKVHLNTQLGQYLNEQCFHVPTQNVDETERFLHYLAQYIPAIWDYFRIVEL